MSSTTAPLPDHEVTYRKARDLILFGELLPGDGACGYRHA